MSDDRNYGYAEFDDATDDFGAPKRYVMPATVVRPGDTIVVQVPVNTHPEVAERAVAQIRSLLPAGVRAVVIAAEKLIVASGAAA